MNDSYCICTSPVATGVKERRSSVERRGRVIVSTSAYHAAGREFDSRSGNMHLGVNRPAIVREIPHFGLFPAFPHFSGFISK